jgi:hypothetical protein
MDTESASAVADPEASGKGRATPKRKDAEAARKKRMAPPRNRREASALRRERMREQRSKQRQALAGGDDRYLPVRDRGPVKKYIRDYVDSHRTIGEYLIPIFIAVLLIDLLLSPLTSSVPLVGSLPWIIVLAALAIDSLRIVRGLREGITQRFGAGEARGAAFYALMRSWQMRRLRLPKATIRRGAEI